MFSANSCSSDFDAKCLIGRKFDDAEVQSDVKHFPFKVFSKGGKPYIRVEYRGEEKEFVSLPFISCISKLIIILYNNFFFVSSRLRKSPPWSFSR